MTRDDVTLMLVVATGGALLGFILVTLVYWAIDCISWLIHKAGR